MRLFLLSFSRVDKMVNLQSRLGKTAAGAMIWTAGMGIAAKDALATIVDPGNYSTPTEQVVSLDAAANGSRQTLDINFKSTLPVPYENDTDFSDGWMLEVVPLDADGNFMTLEQIIANGNVLPSAGVRIYDMNSSYEEFRKVYSDIGSNTDVNGFSLPDVLIEAPGTGGLVDLKGIVENIAFNSGDGTNMISFKPGFPRRLEYPISNETTFNELARTTAIMDETERIPLGYENCDRVTGTKTIDLVMIPGPYIWNGDYNTSGLVWTDNTGEMQGIDGKWDFGLMRLNRNLAGPNAVREEFASFRYLRRSTRDDGPVSDGENLAFRVADAIPKFTDAEPRTVVLGDLFEADSNVPGAKFPQEKPPYVVLQIPLGNGINYIQREGVVPTSQNIWGSAKAIFR